MDLVQGIKTRRSIRKFTDEKVPEQVIREIVELASYAPTWKNSQTISYMCIEDKGIIDRIVSDGLMGHAFNQKTVGRTSQLMLLIKKDGICGYEKDGSYTTSKGSGWEMFDAGIAAQTFCLAAWEKGVGSVIMGIFDDAKVAEIAGVPEGYTVAALIPVGYPVFQPDMPPRKSVDELLSFK